MTEEQFWNWINSLNPIEIQVDEEGNFNPEDLEKLNQRISQSVEELQSENNSNETQA